jgi:hypothetical protein
MIARLLRIVRSPSRCVSSNLYSGCSHCVLSIAIHEYDAKLLLAYWLERAPAVSKTATVSSSFVYPSPKVAQISWDAETGAITPDTQLPSWVFTSKLVAKPDQLIKRRGKSGLLLLNKEWEQAKEWITARAGKEVQVSSFSRRLLLRATSHRWDVIGAREARVDRVSNAQSKLSLHWWSRQF